MVARHQKESRQVQARSGNETYYRYLDTDSERLVTSAIDCATGQLSGAATAEPYPNKFDERRLEEGDGETAPERIRLPSGSQRIPDTQLPPVALQTAALVRSIRAEIPVAREDEEGIPMDYFIPNTLPVDRL